MAAYYKNRMFMHLVPRLDKKKNGKKKVLQADQQRASFEDCETLFGDRLLKHLDPGESALIH